MDILERTIKNLPIRGPATSTLEVALDFLVAAKAVYDLSEANVKLFVGEPLPPPEEWTAEDAPFYRAALRRLYVEPILEWRKSVRALQSSRYFAGAADGVEPVPCVPYHQMVAPQVSAVLHADISGNEAEQSTYSCSPSISSMVFTTVDSRAVAFSHILGLDTECSIAANSADGETSSPDKAANLDEADGHQVSPTNTVTRSSKSPKISDADRRTSSDIGFSEALTNRPATSSAVEPTAPPACAVPSPFTVTIDRVEFDDLRARTELSEQTVTVLQEYMVLMARQVENLKTQLRHNKEPRVQLPSFSSLVAPAGVKRDRLDTEPLLTNKRRRLSSTAPSSRCPVCMKSGQRKIVLAETMATEFLHQNHNTTTPIDSPGSIRLAMAEVTKRYNSANARQTRSTTLETPAPLIDELTEGDSPFYQPTSTSPQ